MISRLLLALFAGFALANNSSSTSDDTSSSTTTGSGNGATSDSNSTGTSTGTGASSTTTGTSSGTGASSTTTGTSSGTGASSTTTGTSSGTSSGTGASSTTADNNSTTTTATPAPVHVAKGTIALAGVDFGGAADAAAVAANATLVTALSTGIATGLGALTASITSITDGTRRLSNDERRLTPISLNVAYTAEFAQAYDTTTYPFVTTGTNSFASKLSNALVAVGLPAVTASSVTASAPTQSTTAYNAYNTLSLKFFSDANCATQQSTSPWSDAVGVSLPTGCPSSANWEEDSTNYWVVAHYCGDVLSVKQHTQASCADTVNTFQSWAVDSCIKASGTSATVAYYKATCTSSVSTSGAYSAGVGALASFLAIFYFF